MDKKEIDHISLQVQAGLENISMHQFLSSNQSRQATEMPASCSYQHLERSKCLEREEATEVSIL